MGIFRVRLNVIALALQALAGIGLWYSAADPARADGREPMPNKLSALAGVVEIDGAKIVRVSVRLQGRIDELFIKLPGQKAKKGEPLADLFSPDVVVTERSLLDARQTGNQNLERICRSLLILWGMDKDQVAEVLQSGKAVGRVSVRCPIEGQVLRNNIKEGQFVDEGASLYDLADLSTIWVECKIKDQADVAFLFRDNVRVRVTAKALQGSELVGEFLGLFRDTDTRNLKVRFPVKNPGQKLLPGTLTTVILSVPETGSSKQRTVVDHEKETKREEEPKNGKAEAPRPDKMKAARLKLNQSELELKRVVELFKNKNASLEDIGEQEITVARNRIVVELLTIVEVRTKHLSRIQTLFELKSVSQRELETASQWVENANKQLEQFEKSER